MIVPGQFVPRANFILVAAPATSLKLSGYIEAKSIFIKQLSLDSVLFELHPVKFQRAQVAGAVVVDFRTSNKKVTVAR